MAALCVVFVRVGTSAAARSEMIAWGTMGKLAQPRTTAVVAPPPSLAEIAPAASSVAPPAVETPAAPRAVVDATPTRAPTRVASPRSMSYTGDPYAARSKAVVPREEKDDAADPYR